MALEELALEGNKVAMHLCTSLLNRFGPGKNYECVVGAAASTLLFHAFRIALPRSSEKAVELLQALLYDVGHSIKVTGGGKIKFTVEWYETKE